MKTSIILFSRDRAMQLDGTLRSLLLHCSDIGQANLFVLYKATTTQHRRHYGILQRQFAANPVIRMVPQGDFRQDLLKMVLLNARLGAQSFLARQAIGLGRVMSAAAGLALSFKSDDSVIFLVDDNIFVRDFSLVSITQALTDHQDALGFSLRLGTNTTYCYPLARQQALPPFELLAAGIQKYAWIGADCDFGYPLELSSSAYRVPQLLPLMMRLRFDNPNQLEDGLARQARLVHQRDRCLLCFTQSVTFCNPVNKVQGEFNNRVASSNRYGADALAALFDDDYRIAVSRYAGFIPNACHQEVELEFEHQVSEAV